ncbi:hypothetical protein VTO42DRAFT_4391 [Malbranchea cinnamomea]
MQLEVWHFRGRCDGQTSPYEPHRPAGPPSMFRLPAERLIRIFEELRTDEQVILAPTCKRLLHISTLVNLKDNDYVRDGLPEDLRTFSQDSCCESAP